MYNKQFINYIPYTSRCSFENRHRYYKNNQIETKLYLRSRLYCLYSEGAMSLASRTVAVVFTLHGVSQIRKMKILKWSPLVTRWRVEQRITFYFEDDGDPAIYVPTWDVYNVYLQATIIIIIYRIPSLVLLISWTK